MKNLASTARHFKGEPLFLEVQLNHCISSGGASGKHSSVYLTGKSLTYHSNDPGGGGGGGEKNV